MKTRPIELSSLILMRIRNLFPLLLFFLVGCGASGTSAPTDSTGATDTVTHEPVTPVVQETPATPAPATPAPATPAPAPAPATPAPATPAPAPATPAPATPAPAPAPAPVRPVAQAMSTGNPTPLAKDSAYMSELLELARQHVQAEIDGRPDIGMIYGDADQTIGVGGKSRLMYPEERSSAMPFVMTTNNSVLASVAHVRNSNGTVGHGISYGGNILNIVGGNANHSYHPLMKRLFAWALSNDPNAALPQTVKYAVSSYAVSDGAKFTDAHITTLLQKAGAKTITKVNCDIKDKNNTCWQEVDLFIFGQGVTNDGALTETVSKYYQAGKTIFYNQLEWTECGSGCYAVNHAIGIAVQQGNVGNYFGENSVAADRTAAQSVQKANDWKNKQGNLLGLISSLQNDSLTAWNGDGQLTTIDSFKTQLRTYEAAGTKLFALDASFNHLKALVLWADMARQGLRYNNTLLNKNTGRPIDFLRAMVADTWTYSVREHTNASDKFGDWMPDKVKDVEQPTESEVIEVTIPQTNGVTAIGRGALPGKAVKIEVLNDDKAGSLALKIGHIRAHGNPVTSDYSRPRIPDGHDSLLLRDGAMNIRTYPWGGPLFLSYTGRAVGTNIKLRITGAIKYAHWDFTKTMTQADLDIASAALTRRDFGWNTAKFVGGEFQQTIGNAISNLGNGTAEDYVIKNVKGLIFDTNHIANGYNNMPLRSKVATQCTDLGWDCTSNIHKAPGVQHFVGWIAQCGYLCSGNPSDGYPGIDTGWGWVHELGHNTVQRVMTIYDCIVECDNNILANAQMMRKYQLFAQDTNGGSIDAAGLFGILKTARATGKTGDALNDEVYNKLWRQGLNTASQMRAVHFQLAFLYTKLQHPETTLPTSDNTLEFFTLLTKGDRLVSTAWDAANKAKYGMSAYSTNTITNDDLLFVLSSKIIGKDLTQLFKMYGFKNSQTALNSVAELNLPAAPMTFYALRANGNNRVTEGQWLDMSPWANSAASIPNYPW